MHDDNDRPTYDRTQRPFQHGHVPGANTLADKAEAGDPMARRQLDAMLDHQRRAQPEERRQGQEGA